MALEKILATALKFVGKGGDDAAKIAGKATKTAADIAAKSGNATEAAEVASKVTRTAESAARTAEFPTGGTIIVGGTKVIDTTAEAAKVVDATADAAKAAAKGGEAAAKVVEGAEAAAKGSEAAEAAAKGAKATKAAAKGAEESKKLGVVGGIEKGATWTANVLKGTWGGVTTVFADSGKALSFVGKNWKQMLFGGVIARGAYNYVTDGTPVIDTLPSVGNALVGEDRMKKAKEMAGWAYDATVEKGKDVAQKTSETVDDISKAASAAKQTATEIKDQVSSTIGRATDYATDGQGVTATVKDEAKDLIDATHTIARGNSMSTIGNFIHNLTSGNVSMLGIGGMIVGAMMMFGRSGILGKIGGLLMLSLLIGSNSQSLHQTPILEQNQDNGLNQNQGQSRGRTREEQAAQENKAASLGWGR